jgi:hypothetical protein
VRKLTYAEVDDVLHLVKGGIPTFYVENVVIPNLMSIPGVEIENEFE